MSKVRIDDIDKFEFDNEEDNIGSFEKFSRIKRTKMKDEFDPYKNQKKKKRIRHKELDLNDDEWRINVNLFTISVILIALIYKL